MTIGGLIVLTAACMISEQDPVGETEDRMLAATLVILRRAVASASAVGTSGPQDKWEVLLGQNCVKNWLRSTKDHSVIMRYPGEWKFPGGVLEDCDDCLADTATRELREEFLGLTVPNADISMYLVNRKLTKSIKGKRFLMYNYVAMEDDNAWISETDIANTINGNLRRRIHTFNEMLSNGSYWDLSDEEKSLVSPELVMVKWMPLSEAVQVMGSSLDESLTCLNDFQRDEFIKYDINSRDPMFQSMVTLMEIEKLGSYENFRAHDIIMRASNEL